MRVRDGFRRGVEFSAGVGEEVCLDSLLAKTHLTDAASRLAYSEPVDLLLRSELVAGTVSLAVPSDGL